MKMRLVDTIVFAFLSAIVMTTVESQVRIAIRSKEELWKRNRFHLNYSCFAHTAIQSDEYFSNYRMDQPPVSGFPVDYQVIFIALSFPSWNSMGRYEPRVSF